MPAPRRRASKLVLAAVPSAVDPPALDPVRAGGRLLQPVRRHGAHVAGAAADRRRHIPGSSRSLSATSPRRSRPRSTAGPGRHDLRARRPGGEDLQGADGIRAGDHRAPPRCWCRCPFALAKLQARLPAAAAQAAADAGPGRAPAQPTTSCRSWRSAKAARSKRSASTPSPMATIVPSYLWRFRKTGQFQDSGRQSVGQRRNPLRAFAPLQNPSASAISPSVADDDAPPREQREAVARARSRATSSPRSSRQTNDDAKPTATSSVLSAHLRPGSCRDRRRRRRPWSASRGRTRTPRPSACRRRAAWPTTMVAPERDTPGIIARHWPGR